MILRLKNISKLFGTKTALSSINIDLKKGEVLGLIGESGSGKTTLLRLIAGLEKPSKGSISLEEKLMNHEKVFILPENRKVGFLFQDYGLFPHLTVLQNILFGVKSKKVSHSIQSLIEIAHIDQLLEKHTYQLSGGEQQRVALIRALATKPSLLLLDEPFSNLDHITQIKIREELFRIIRQSETSCIFVTHDMNDALAEADQIAVLKKGKIIQAGLIDTLYKKPNSEYIATLFGPINILNTHLLNLIDYQPREQRKYIIRPHDIYFILENELGSIPVIIKSKKFMGTYYEYKVKGPNLTFIEIHATKSYEIGENRLFIKIKKDKILMVTEDGENSKA